MKTKKLKIGHQTYKLIEDVGAMTAAGAFGMCDQDRSWIKYRANTPDDILADTLVHETLHAIVHNYVYHIDGAGEEEIVTQLAHGIVQVMRDNPKFFDEVRSLL